MPSADPREMGNAIATLIEAARQRFDVWTRETYVALDDAFKRYDALLAQAAPSSSLAVDWRAELRAFRAHVNRPQPCPRPEQCENFSCDVDAVAIKAFDRVDSLLAAVPFTSTTPEKKP